MRYIDSWLTGLGLEYVIPKLKANGITTPKKLAQLTLRDMYEVGESLLISVIAMIFIGIHFLVHVYIFLHFLFDSPLELFCEVNHVVLFCSLIPAVGVEDAEDRKKLYFLIQRLHTVSDLYKLTLTFAAFQPRRIATIATILNCVYP